MSSSLSSSNSNPKSSSSDGTDGARPVGGLDRPAFNQLYEADISGDRPPTSALAYLAFAVGLISLIAPMSFKLVPLAVMAVVLATLVYWQLSRDSARYAGLRWAQFGLGLGLVSLVWSLTANSLANSYFYDQAGRHAKVYLDLVGQGRMFEALELHVTKSGRQIAGTDLEAYYMAKTGEESEGILQVINSEATQEVKRLGGKANWSFLGGVEVQPASTSQSVTVRMTNDVEPDRVATVTLTRNYFNDSEGRRVAWWEIDKVTFDDLTQRPKTAVR